MTNTSLSSTAQELLEKIESEQALVGIIGLGYVGLPLALAVAEQGFSVLGFDIDSDKTERLNRGESYLDHLDGSRVGRVVKGGRLEATSDFARLTEPDVLVICVPTPLTPQREPEMTYVRQTAKQIASRLRRGQLVVLESTTYPGTTEELLQALLEQGGLVCGEEFFLAYSPEREDPGNPVYGTASIPKVLGGVNEASATVAEAFYAKIVSDTVQVSSARAAEATKLTENIFRAVNIALVNELKVIYDRMGIDIWEVLDAAETKPFGFMRFNPGPGWGGHCIPVDPFYLSWKAREHGVTPRFIELAGQVNVEMPHYVVSKLQTALNERGKAIKGSKILILGIAYKKDVSDPRESPAFEIIHQLLGLGAEVTYHDAHIPEAPVMRSWPDLPALRSQSLSTELLAAQDAVLLITDHTDVDYDLVLEHAPLVIDTRGHYEEASAKVYRA